MKKKLGRILMIKNEGNKEKIKKENQYQYDSMFNRKTKEIKPIIIARIANYYNANYYVNNYKQIECYWVLEDILKQFNLKYNEFKKYCKKYGVEYNKSTWLYDIPLELMQKSFPKNNILEYNQCKKQIKRLESKLKCLKEEKNTIDTEINKLQDCVNELKNKRLD